MTEPRDPAAPPPRDGGEPRLIGGRYRMGPVIGRGGMATIHHARDLRTDRDVAVKLLRPEVSRDPDLAQRFRREALAATVLRHPNVVACLGTGTDGDQPYLVMELVDGEDLAARLRRGGRLAPAQVARIGLDVARGLGVAHARGIVHRDIKPGNIMLAADGRAMVADFGIARLGVDAEAAMPGTTLGSVHYFSPEQARGTTTTPASDVYGLGLVLYEALTGARAWTGATTDAIALARVGAPAPSPRAVVAEVPAELDAIVRCALAPEAEGRYPHGSAMAAALEPIVAAADPDATAPVATSVAETPPLVPSSPPSPVSPSPVSPPRRRSDPAGFGIAVGALAVVGVLLGVVLVAALPGDGVADPGSGGPVAVASATARATPSGTNEPTIEPPTSTASGTPAPPTDPPRTPPPGKVADLCETFLDFPCGLEAGRYAPSRFEPAFDIKLGTGWSSALHAPDLVTVTRDEGLMTFASPITEVYPSGRATEPRDRARDIIEAFVVTDGLSSTKPAKVKIGGEKGFSVDLAPVDDRPVLLFRTSDHAYALQPGRVTRLVAVDVDGRAIVFAIEPAPGLDLRSIMDTADDAAATMRWR